jgi:hypothetical protein
MLQQNQILLNQQLHTYNLLASTQNLQLHLCSNLLKSFNQIPLHIYSTSINQISYPRNQVRVLYQLTSPNNHL